MKKLLLIGLLFTVSACATPITDDEYVKCEHLYDDSKTVLTKHFNNIQHVSVTDCPDIIKYRSGACPALVKIITLEQEIVWLTQLEFENYKCTQMKEY